MRLHLNFSMRGLCNRGEWRGENLLSIEKLLEHSGVQDQRKERTHSVSFSNKLLESEKLAEQTTLVFSPLFHLPLSSLSLCERKLAPVRTGRNLPSDAGSHRQCCRAAPPKAVLTGKLDWGCAGRESPEANTAFLRAQAGGTCPHPCPAHGPLVARPLSPVLTTYGKATSTCRDKMWAFASFFNSIPLKCRRTHALDRGGM